MQVISVIFSTLTPIPPLTPIPSWPSQIISTLIQKYKTLYTQLQPQAIFLSQIIFMHYYMYRHVLYVGYL